jgi:hypothetical protein
MLLSNTRAFAIGSMSIQFQRSVITVYNLIKLCYCGTGTSVIAPLVGSTFWTSPLFVL